MKNKHHQTPHGGSASFQRPSQHGGRREGKNPDPKWQREHRWDAWIERFGTNSQRAQLIREARATR